MTAKKFIIPFVLASLAGHALVLALTSRVDWTLGSQPEKSQTDEQVMTVELKASPKPDHPPSFHRRGGNTPATVTGVGREYSAVLQGDPGPYGDYLLHIRRKIERLWVYPPQALAAQGEGDAVIRFTIDANGALSGYYVMATSGSPVLDEGALAVVKGAAPYEPIPAAFNLSRFHITATFSYRVGD
jgi:TonB family protein